MESAMRIRRVRAHEGVRLREVRLRALAEAPAAFGSTRAEALGQPPEFWDGMCRECADGAACTIFVAEQDETWYGMVRGFVHRDYPGIVRLASMWVDPARRRAGVGAALVAAIAAWACARGAGCVQLWVTDTNHAAKALYARQGFAESGRAKPHRTDPVLREVLMVRTLPPVTTTPASS